MVGAYSSCRNVLFVDEWSKALQGHDNLFQEQNARIKKVIDDMRGAVRVEGPLTELDLLTTVGEKSCRTRG